MEKIKLFIGSSVEGINVAFAIQDNLQYNAEITVWDQDVFNLSETSIESLIKILQTCDFGIFVFTPDDYIKIRGKKDLVVRDNVIFELGLFIGKLGRERCYIILPDNKEFHLPTDLAGITPAKYDASRSDNNLKAGTGIASNKIRETIVKLGRLNKSNDETEPKSQSEGNIIVSPKNEDWIELIFFSKKYDEAIKVLKKKIRYERNSARKISYKTYVCFAEFQKDSQIGCQEYEKLIIENPNNSVPYLDYANVLYKSNSFAKAIQILDEGLHKCQNNANLIILKSVCLWETNKKEIAIKFLLNSINNVKDPSIYIKLSEYFVLNNQQDLALKTLYESYLEFPNNENIISSFALVLHDLKYLDVCALLYNILIQIKPNNSNYWCLLGNAYLELDLYNLALNAYEKANELVNGKENWILSNIGNLYNNKELYDKAEYYLNLAQIQNNSSEYTHKRLSELILSKEKEQNKLNDITRNAKEKLNGSFEKIQSDRHA